MSRPSSVGDGRATVGSQRATAAKLLVAVLLVASLAYTLLTRTSLLLWLVLLVGVVALWLLYRLVVAVEEIAASV